MAEFTIGRDCQVRFPKTGVLPPGTPGSLKAGGSHGSHGTLSGFRSTRFGPACSACRCGLTRELNTAGSILVTGFIAVLLASALDLNTGKQAHQLLDLDVLDRVDGRFDLVGEVNVNAAGNELVELGDHLVPCERPLWHPWIVLHLMFERGAVLQAHGDFGRHPARVLGGV